MKRYGSLISLVAVLSLAITAIWHTPAHSAVNPTVTWLGQIRSGLSAPTRLDIDSAGILYVTDPRKNAVLRFDQYGAPLTPLKGDYRISGAGVAVTPDGSRVYTTIVTAVAANGLRSIKGVGVLDGKTGALLGYLGPNGNAEFNEAGEIDLDAQGLVYVADIADLKIKVYDPTSNRQLYSFGGQGTTNGLFWWMRGMSVDTYNQEVYVVDPSTNNGIVRVQVFSLTGTFKRVIAQASFATPVICFPSGLAFDNFGRGYMAEGFYSDLRIFQSGPTFASLSVYGAFGYGQGQFSQPYDLAYDPNTKRLFVANDGAHIEIFGIDGGNNPVNRNNPPGKPAIVAPAKDQVVAAAAPQLQWQAAVDPDGDVLTYDILLQKDGQTVQALSKVSGTSVVAAPLVDNTRYSWSLQASDGKEVSGYTATETFWVDAVKEAPAVPALVAPADAAVLDGSSPFSWLASSGDPDPFDTVVGYRLQIADSAAFTNILINYNQATATATPAFNALPGYDKIAGGVNTTYYWRVLAIDNDGVASDGQVRTFKRNLAPGLPVALSPVSDSLVASATPQLQWQAAVDPDGDVLTYNVQIQKDGQLVQTLNNVAGTSVVTGELAENSRYSWNLQASDSLATSAYTAVETFWVDAVQEAPVASLLSVPATGSTLDGSATFAWGASVDADPLDVVGYRLQIADSADFSNILIDEAADLQSAALKSLTGYSSLKDGSTYFWRVLATDNDGLSTASEVRTFVYDTTVLAVTASFPGAKVYLGGNYAYSGQYLGEAPIELRDLAAGATSLVVEAPGFEPYIVPLNLGERANVNIAAQLVPAIAPTGLKARPISAGGEKIQGSSELIPMALDYNNDGFVDLFTADASGKLTYYRALDNQLTFAAGTKVDVVLPAGAAPVAADWNNDKSVDLIVGAADGSVKLFANFSGPGQALIAGGAPLNVGSSAIPCVLDINADGKKDLVVGSGNGSVTLYTNIGTDAAPAFESGAPLLPAISGNAAPFATDWNADGKKDLLVATSQHIFVFYRQANGSFAAQAVLSVEDDLTGKTGKASSGSGYLGDKLRLAALDLDGKGGKDLVVGNAAGQLRFVASFGKDPVPAFGSALLAKLDEIEAVATQSEVLTALAAIRTSIAGGKYPQAKDAINALLPSVTDATLSSRLKDLAGVL